MLQVTNSPFNQEQVELLNKLLPTLTDAQKVWLSGYLSAMNQAGNAVSGALPQAEALAVNVPAISKEVTVLYGSQTGNSQKLANELANKLQEQSFEVSVASMSDFKPNALKKVENLFVVISTHGEGDPPDTALSFHEFILGKRAPKFENMRFSVLALGDTSYEFFCKTGIDFDERLAELGGERIVPRADCDVDFDDTAEEWMDHVLTAMREASAAPVTASPSDASLIVGDLQSEYSRTNPFQATVLENIDLNGRGSKRETRHLEISLEGSNFKYEPGDCLGIYPDNHPQLVEDIIQAAGLNADELVPVNKNGDEKPLKEALTRHFEISILTKPLIEKAAKLLSSSELSKLLAEGEEKQLRAYINERDVLDLIQDYKIQGISGKDFVSILRKLPGRLYSIANSPTAYEDEVHVTIRKVEFESNGRKRYGVCSTYSAESLNPDDHVSVYIHDNPNFKMPQNPDAPIIMIGPGTGVAPFRAFLGEREEIGAEGKSWLFYGDQHFSTDFLYQVEWQNWLKDGVLTRMDVAFSRDQAEKIYVQQRMLENSKDFYEWLQDGAYLYVCGDEKNMAHDVHAALLTILQQEGGLNEEQASEYVKQLQQEKRYQRDVY